MGALLQNFPIVTQLDGDKNQSMDCVAACISACLQHLTGNKFTASMAKDAVYGVSYTGPTNPPNYVGYCKSHGVQMTAINGSPNYLVEMIHHLIVAGQPCLVTVPDRYAPASLGWTHVLAAYGCDGSAIGVGSITLLDPYIAQPLTYSNTELAGMLRFDQIWSFHKM